MDDFQYFQTTTAAQQLRLAEPDLFGATLNVSAHEIAMLVRHLETVGASKRLEALKALRKVLKKAHNCLPSVARDHCFQVVGELIAEDTERPLVLCECLWLVVDVLPSLGGHSVDACVTPLLPHVVSALGSESADVRRAALRLIHVFTRYTLNLQKCLKSLVRFGLETKGGAQKGVVLALPLLLTEELSRENLFVLADSLGRVLVSADTDLFYAVFLALQRLHSVVGNETFGRYLDAMDTEARELYRSVLSRNPSVTDSTDAKEDTLLEPMSSQSVVSKENKSHKTVSIRVDPKTMTSDDTEDDTQSQSEYIPALKFGLVPIGLILSAMSSHVSDERLEALQAILQLVRDAPHKRLTLLVPHVDSFLDFISLHLLSEQNNFKITLFALDIIETVVERLGSAVAPFVATVVNTLLPRLGDGRTVVRDSVVRVCHQLMYSYPPQDILDQLLASRPSKSARVREEVVNRVTAAVLTFPRTDFNLPKLCFGLAPLLADRSRSVRLASLESMAVIAQALGPQKLSPLMAAVEAVESTCFGSDGSLVAALKARLARRSLPRCAADGTVRYVLNISGQQNQWFGGGMDADLQWILMATNGGQNSCSSSSKPANGGHHLAAIPYDRRRGAGLMDNNNDNSVDIVAEMVRRKSMAETNIDKLLTSGAVEDMDERNGMEAMERSFLEGEEGVEGVDRRWSEESSASSLEVWRQYFSQFRRQLASVAFNADTNGDSETVVVGADDSGRRRRSLHLPLPLPVQSFVSAQDISADEFRPSSPQQSSSAPSTASADIQYFPPQHMSSSVEQVDKQPFEPQLERSMSLPSIAQPEEDEMEMERGRMWACEEEPKEGVEDHIEDNKTPVPTLAAPDGHRDHQQHKEDHKDNAPSREPPALSVQEASPLRRRTSSPPEPERRPSMSVERLDVWTQKDETLSSETTSDDRTPRVVTQAVRRKRAQPLGRQSRSQSPQNRRRPSRPPQHIYIKTTPAIPANANIRHILGNVAKTEGPFDNPPEAMRAALMALTDDAWTTKVEGMLAVTRLATFHAHTLLKDQHQVVRHLVAEVKNLRSTVSRSAIFTIGELFARLKTQIEPEMDAMVSCLLHKAGENVVFIREDIDRALTNCVEEMPQTRAALALIGGGATHRNTFVRKTSANFLSQLVDRMGPNKCLLGPRDIGEHLLPTAARFVQDQSPHTRFFGRKIFAVLMAHNAFEKLLRKHVTPGTYRNIVGILESIKRRGIGDRPQDLSSSPPLRSTPAEDPKP